VSRFLDRLGRTAARRHWWFIVGWLVAAVGAVAVAVALDGQTNDNFTIPGAQSQQALDLLEERFPSQSGATATVVFDAPQGIDDPSVRPAIEASIADLEKIPHVTSESNHTPHGLRVLPDRRTNPVTGCCMASDIGPPVR